MTITLRRRPGQRPAVGGVGVVDTCNAKGGSHLRSDDFFCADTPTGLTFALSGVDVLGGQTILARTLTVGEQSPPATMPNHSEATTTEPVTPSERPLSGTMSRTASFFTQEDALDCAWESVDLVLDGTAQLEKYDPASSGPSEMVWLTIATHDRDWPDQLKGGGQMRFDRRSTR